MVPIPKILTIEDSAFERKAIRGILNKAGYTDIIEAESGEIGIEKFKVERPDLVLLDLGMPGMSGIEVLQRLKQIDPSVKVIIASIVRKRETIDETLQMGVQAYITKPITYGKLIPEIKKGFRRGCK